MCVCIYIKLLFSNLEDVLLSLWNYYILCYSFLCQDIAGTLATEEAEDTAQVSKLRSALESVDHKRRKVA